VSATAQWCRRPVASGYCDLSLIIVLFSCSFVVVETHSCWLNPESRGLPRSRIVVPDRTSSVCESTPVVHSCTSSFRSSVSSSGINHLSYHNTPMVILTLSVPLFAHSTNGYIPADRRTAALNPSSSPSVHTYRWLRKHCRSLRVVHGWPQWHCPYLAVRFLCGGYNSTSTPVVLIHTDGYNSSVGFVVPRPAHIANANGHVDSVGSLFYSMSRPSAVDRIAGLYFQSLVGLFPYQSIASLHRCLPVWYHPY
jgi:hypothetical protein